MQRSNLKKRCGHNARASKERMMCENRQKTRAVFTCFVINVSVNVRVGYHRMCTAAFGT
jgi:hypothetical protein